MENRDATIFQRVVARAFVLLRMNVGTDFIVKIQKLGKKIIFGEMVLRTFFCRIKYIFLDDATSMI